MKGIMDDVAIYKPLVPADLKPPMNITLVQDGAGLERLAKGMARILALQVPIAGVDTETNFVHDFWNRRVRTIQIGDKDEQFVIDLLPFAGSEEKLIESQAHYGKYNGTLYEPIFKILTPVLCTAKVLKVGQNLSFEYEVFNWNFGKRIWHLYSTDLAEKVIHAGRIGLKKYKEFSMLRIMQRYFGVTINKDEQKHFDLCSPLTQEQIDYAALDIRTPLAMRLAQLKVLTAEQLLATVQIENDALGTYVDMHLVGQNMDDERWLKRIEAVKLRRIQEVKILDESFIPIVGTKTTAINYNELDRLEKIWREDFEEPTADEMATAAAIRQEKDKTRKDELRVVLKNQKQLRAMAKAEARKNYNELSKFRTKALKIIEKCEGEAFINYGSNTQLLDALQKFPGMKHIESVGDDVLLKFNDRPLIQVLRKYRKGKKETGTYGEVWTQKWVNKPIAKEGWRHPGDGRLHCQFNQLEAETGRSSSEKPNAMNLPKDDEVRACFICDPPNPEVRVSVCCDYDTKLVTYPEGQVPSEKSYVCQKCFTAACETKDEEYCIVTVDMAGAELRIIAELAQAQTWITAFAKGQDVHSVSTEILYPEKWPAATEANCAYFKKGADGQPERQKCECKGHKALRDGTKAINFLLCYGGGPDALADQLGVTLETAKDLMRLHEQKFPEVWAYLYRSGEEAKRNKESRDMYGRRRLFLEPTYELAREWVKDNEDEKLELNEEEIELALFAFKAKELREPNEDELWMLTHRAPTDKEIRQGMRAMMGSIGRRGKNHCIQGTNASIIKRAMGCGFDKNGKPYLWHTLPQFRARIQNMVHDELVVHCPKRFGEQVKALVGDAFKRAAAEVMVMVIMEFDGHIADRWMK